jgi:Cof subfamily protein (haloacid dehalogenase superfamily)
VESRPTYRAVVTDLDGTIVRTDGTVSTATMNAAAALRRRGVPLVAATARTPPGVAALGPLTGYLTIAVCCGGALGLSPTTGQVLWREDIAGPTVGQIVRAVTERLPGAGIAGHDGHGWAMTHEFASLRGSRLRGPAQVVPVAEIADRQVCAMSVCHPYASSVDLLDMLAAIGLDPPVTLTYSAANLVDIAPTGIDKRAGVGRALELLGVAPADTIAFGDMPNDLSMLRLCGHPVAVRNAHRDVLAAAATITDSVDEDGFARLLTVLGMTDQVGHGEDGEPLPRARR